MLLAQPLLSMSLLPTVSSSGTTMVSCSVALAADVDRACGESARLRSAAGTPDAPAGSTSASPSWKTSKASLMQHRLMTHTVYRTSSDK